jgi:FtsZ-binding cell division protein ZapB
MSLDIKKMRTCLHLLPEPGNQVVGECLDEIERLVTDNDVLRCDQVADAGRIERLKAELSEAIKAKDCVVIDLSSKIDDAEQKWKTALAKIESVRVEIAMLREENAGLLASMDADAFIINQAGSDQTKLRTEIERLKGELAYYWQNPPSQTKWEHMSDDNRRLRALCVELADALCEFSENDQYSDATAALVDKGRAEGGE